jgi:hypothetical protein
MEPVRLDHLVCGLECPLRSFHTSEGQRLHFDFRTGGAETEWDSRAHDDLAITMGAQYFPCCTKYHMPILMVCLLGSLHTREIVIRYARPISGPPLMLGNRLSEGYVSSVAFRASRCLRYQG